MRTLDAKWSTDPCDCNVTVLRQSESDTDLMRVRRSAPNIPKKTMRLKTKHVVQL